MPDIISNSSCLISLDNIRMISVLQELYGNIFICEEVYKEYGKPVEPWIKICRVRDRKYLNIMKNFIDEGESGTIALSLELENSIMILDDLKARKIAKKLNLKFTGLLGVMLRAKEMKIINSISEVLTKLKSANFRISEPLEAEVLRLAGE